VEQLIAFIHKYGTRTLGVSAGTITTLCGTGIVPASHMKYYMAALAMLTYWRGQSTSNAYDKGVSEGLSGPPAAPLFYQPKVKS
jgi:hypothetical protein